jgi:hypothetical protein
MTDQGRDLVEKMHGEAAAQLRQAEYGNGKAAQEDAPEEGRQEWLVTKEQPTIHYTELTDLAPDSPLYREWKAYRRELPRLLVERQEGRFALFRGDDLIGIFATLDEGVRRGRQAYGFQPFLVQPIRERQPLLRIHRLC